MVVPATSLPGPNPVIFDYPTLTENFHAEYSDDDYERSYRSGFWYDVEILQPSKDKKF